ELHGVDAQLAQVVPEHDLVLEIALEIAVDVEARRVARAVILVGDQARVDAVPERERAAQAARAGVLRDAGADVELLTEAVVETAAEDYLPAVSHLRVLRPDEEHVRELRVVDPPLEVQIDLVQLEVIAQIERLR